MKKTQRTFWAVVLIGLMVSIPQSTRTQWEQGAEQNSNTKETIPQTEVDSIETEEPLDENSMLGTQEVSLPETEQEAVSTQETPLKELASLGKSSMLRFSQPVSNETELLQAIDAVVDEGTITIAADMEIANSIIIPTGKTITLTSQAPSVYTIKPDASFDSEKRMLLIGGACTIENLVLDGEQRAVGIAVNFGSLFFNGGAVVKNARSTLVDSDGAGIQAANGSYLEINGGEISNNTSPSNTSAIYSGGGVNIVDSTAVMRSGRIVDNRSYHYGGGVSIHSNDLTGKSTFTMLGGLIDGNESVQEYGGGVYVSIRGIFTMKDGVISNNRAQSGGGVFLGKPGTLSQIERDERHQCEMYMEGGTIQGHSATYFGGAIYGQWNAFVKMTGGKLTDNTAAAGGAIALATATSRDYYTVSLIAEGGEISENTASAYGGGIYAYPAAYESYDIPLQVVIGKDDKTGPTIHQNKAAIGGGVHLQGPTFAEMLGGSIHDNTVNLNGLGGGISAYQNSTFTMSGGTVSRNQAIDGGGLYLFKNKSQVELFGGVISDNTSTRHGGGVYARDTEVLLSDLLLSKNHANNGGGLYITSDAECEIENQSVFSENAASTDGGAIYTEEYDYADPVATGKYNNITMEASTKLIRNSAIRAYDPPSNAADFINLSYSQTSVQNGNEWVHPLNNYDINYVFGGFLGLCDVTYDANGGDGGYVDGSFLTNTTYTVLSDIATGISKDEHTFLEWNTQANGLGLSYQPGDTFTILQDEILYAIWRENRYTAKYHWNDGSANIYHTQDDIAPNDLLQATKPADPVRSGYRFTGWYKEANTQTLWNFDVDTVTQNVDLYAGWVVLPTSTETTTRPTTTTTKTPTTQIPTTQTPSTQTPSTQTPSTQTPPIQTLATQTPEESTTTTAQVTPETGAIRQTQKATNTAKSEDGKEDEVISVLGAPLYGGSGEAVWALLNLILTILALVGTIGVTVRWIVARGKTEEENREQETNENEKTMIKKRRLWWTLGAALVSVLMVIVFLITEDMRLPMVWLDRWTLCMVFLFVIDVIAVIFCFHKKKKVKAEG